MPPLQLFFAIHDVTPFHLTRLKRAEALFEKWGVEKILYLLVPNYHGAHRADRDANFRTWCHRKRPFEIEWCQHGYFHVVTQHAASVATAGISQRPGRSRRASGRQHAVRRRRVPAPLARVAARPADPADAKSSAARSIASRPVSSRRNGWATGTWSKFSPSWDTPGPRTITRFAIWPAAGGAGRRSSPGPPAAHGASK